MAPTPLAAAGGAGDKDKLHGTDYYKVETPRSDAASMQVFAAPTADTANADAADDDKLKLTKKDDSDSDGGTTSDSSSDKKKKPKKDDAPKSFAFASLYRYATPFDKLLLFIGVCSSTFNGALFPMMAIVFGNVLTGFAQTPVDQDKINTAALDYFLVAIGMFISEYISYVTFYYTAERQMKALRSEALQHMLYMDIGWYDQNDALQLSSRLSGDTVKIKDGMGQKLGDLFRFTTQFCVGIIIGFWKGWDITLVMAAVMPFMAISLMWLIKTMRAKSEWAQKVYAQAGAVAEETLSQIRTVASLNAEKRALEKFQERTKIAETENIQLAKYTSGVFAMFLGSIWVMYSVGLWYGGWKVSNNKATPSEVFQAFFGILMGSGSLAQISPNLTAVAQATGSAQALFKILDTKSKIDAKSDEGIVPEKCDGAITVENVFFSYPTRPEAPVLVDYNLNIEAGQTVAFVGSSGGGKSTLVALLERFYDPQSGKISLDGNDLKTLNVRWLREQIGIVQQEPVLFQTSIFENIAKGGNQISKTQAMEAAKMANAHDFIMALPQGYDTLVGEKGVTLSGGQKQRVAIARAIVRNPKILVLDEATSALDNESERVVQAALNDLMDKTQMTTLVIAHRLSTVRRADQIVVLNGGHIVEKGTHEQLLKIENGIYQNMYTLQELKPKHGDHDVADPVAATVAAVEDKQDEELLLRRASFVSTQSTTKSVANVENNELEKPKFGVLDIFKLSSPERKFFYIGMVGAAFGGISLPASALLVSGMITSMTMQYGKFLVSENQADLDELYDDVSLYGILYLIGAVVLMVFIFMQFFCFKYMMEKVTTRMRDTNFQALCRQNIGFFDEKSNATGALTADLNTNATKVAMLSGDSQARVVQAVFTLSAAIVISFLLGSWLLTLIMLGVFPLLVGGQWVRMQQIHKRDAISDELAEPGAHASERLSNIRTVVSLGMEKHSSEQFHELLEEPFRKGHAQAQINAIALGFSSFIMMAVYALVFWYGGKMVSKGDATFEQVIRTLMAITMSLQGVMGAASYFGDSEAAVKAGTTIMALKNRSVLIDTFDPKGDKPGQVGGKLEFQNVSFRYPTRPEVSVLKKYNLVIEAGETVAFCGPSGGGKSTIIGLIERFYDPVKGNVLLDGHDLKELNVNWLRNQIGLVGQEPVLFTGSIAENIAYGLERPASQEEIEVAAKMANAHDYITQFPDGYNTQVGMKGEQLSGGQKQRIAIARAILKDPKVLLLDEATSALDSESEKVVQEALDKVVALKKRTTIIIAHRLSTIRKADKICVVSGGKIAEQGTHEELLAKKGLYANLVDSATS